MSSNKVFFAVISLFMLFFLSGCSEDFNDGSSRERSPYLDPTQVATLKLHYQASLFMTIPGLGSCEGNSFQGFAVYNDVAFCFYHSGICRTIDLNTKEILGQFYLPDEAHHGRNHAGVACFSEEFYSPDDDFPLLYLSSYQENKCYVLRIGRSGAELVQTIYTYEGNNHDLAPVLAYEPDGDILLLKLRNSSYYHWVSINRPDVHSEKTVYLNLADRIDIFEVYSTSAYNAGFALHGKIYQLAGYRRDDYKLYVLDYVNKQVLVDEYWNNNILKDYEQEQCSRFKNGLLINYNKSDQLVYVEIYDWEF